jgi:hypothetical protein
MNRRKSARSISFGSVLLLVVAAILIAAAGVFQACVKNRQVEVARNIEKTEHRIVQVGNETKTVQMYLDRQLNRFLVKERLKQLGSTMTPIKTGDIEEVDLRTQNKPMPELVLGGSEYRE